MATTEATSTKDQVRAMLDEGIEDATVMADRLGVGKATIYNHIRNIRAERGEKPRKRGRPPAVRQDGDSEPQETRQAPAKSRPAPPKAASGTRAAPATKSETKDSGGSGNGVGRTIEAQDIMRFLRRPRVQEAIRRELEDERANLGELEKWLDG